MATSGTVNVKSRLLSGQENETIFSIIGRRCQSLGTTLAELSRAEDDKRETWKTICSGVVCFVKDSNRRSFFVRFYERENKTLVWEHDTRIRSQTLSYSTTSDGSLTLTVKDHKLTFSNKDEADEFRKIVDGKMATLKSRRAKLNDKARYWPPPPPPPVRSSEDAQTVDRKSSKKDKKKLSKEDIACPTQFRHVSNVGWDPTTGITTQNLEPEMKALFDQIGIQDQSDIDRETLDFIFDFVDKHGGLEAVKKDAARRQVPPPPPTNRSSVPPPPPPGGRYVTPPPPPSANRSVVPPPPPPTNRSAVPPPPPSTNRSVVPPPPSSANRSAVPPPPSANRSAVPPPPPSANRCSVPPPPPSASRKVVPPPPPSTNRSVVPPPPPPSNRSSVPPPPPAGTAYNSKSSGEATSLQQPASKDNENQSSDMKQQIMQLLLQNPSEMADFIYNIIDKKGGLADLKGGLAGKNTQPEPVQQKSDQVPGRPSDDNHQGAPGPTFDDQVPGRMTSENTCISGGERVWSSDYDLGSDMLDSDEEWDD